MRSAAFRRAQIFGLALALLVSFLLASCSDTPAPGELDAANIVVGDASVLDVGLRPDAAPAADAIALDATETSSDASVSIDMDARVQPDAAAGNRDASAEPDATIPPECNGAPVATLTATAALAQAAALDGMIVDIVGTATVGPTLCTATVCPPENPCCNRCSAGIELEGGLLVSSGPCGNVGCTGDECNLVCSPPLLGFPQTFRGTLRSPDALELHRVLP